MKATTTWNAARRRRLADGDEGEWDAFFAEFDPLIASVVAWPKWRFTRDLRDDIAQIIRREIVKALPRFREQSNLRTFIRRIAANRCIDEVRRQVRERQTIVHLQGPAGDEDDRRPEPVAGPGFDPITLITQSERAGGLRHALEAMDNTCREAITDFYVRDLSYKEMARRHGITVNTVGSRLAKCLQKLRKALEHDPEFGDMYP